MGATSLAGLLLVLLGCGGGEGAARSDTTGAIPPAAEPAPAPADTAAPAGGDTTRTAGTADTGTAAAAQPSGKSGAPSPQAIALGDSIFHGKVAGAACTACHGQDAKGTAVAPNLTDAEWINTDGSYEGIVKVVTNGVPQPKQHPAPMPPKGGAALDDAQVRAVAAYVFSLSHKS
jgi:mono/diheme cytochrome c family protein